MEVERVRNMLSGRLVHLIEANSASIIQQVISQIRRDPELTHVSKLPDAELREYGEHLLDRLGDWLEHGTEHEIGDYYEDTGRLRFEEGVPLYEAVQGLFLVKNKMIDFVLNQAAARTYMQLYAEEELEHRVDRFFDILVCHLVKGYENALRRSARVSAFAG
jgi:hypothetical protein